MKNVLIIGATSGIAKEYARIMANRGSSLFLMGRSREKLSDLEKDLKVRGAKSVHLLEFDGASPSSASKDISKAESALGKIDIALIAHGTLPDQGAAERSFESAAESFTVNFLSPVAYTTALIETMIGSGGGTVAVITSVAGDRGRKSNYVYGSAKAALSTYLAGLRHRFGKDPSMHILDIRPGFVDTPMTSHLKKGPLFASPKAVAKDIAAAIDKRRGVIYTPWFWRWIMFIIRSIPEFIFKKTNI